MANRVSHGPGRDQAVVVGAGFAGCLAAAALAAHVERVVLLDRDAPTDLPRRPGLPQAPHAHLLLSAGAQAVDALLPGTTGELRARGAHRISMPSGVLTYTPHGWLARIPEVRYFLSCTRLLTDQVVRERVAGNARVELREGVAAVGLTGDAGRVTGVQVRHRDSGERGTLPASLVVDASGARSPAPAWLAALGLPSVDEVVVDPGLAYATRVLRLPDELRGLPALYVQADPAGAGRGGVLLPVEGDRWLLSLSGVRGARPPVDEAGFTACLAGLRHPVLAEIASRATPLSAVQGFRGPANRWRRYERLRPWPDGFLALGDAVRTVNPAYGHGMSVAALGALALADALRRDGLGAGLAARAQRAVVRAGTGAWAMAVGQDTRYPRTTGLRPSLPERLFTRYGDRVTAAAVVHGAATAALIDTFTLAAPPTRLLAPRVVLAALRPGPRQAGAHPAADAPPFTDREALAVPGAYTARRETTT